MLSSGAHRSDLLPGTLELTVLRALTTMGPQHAYGTAARVKQVANHAVRLNQGTPYTCPRPAGAEGPDQGHVTTTKNNREAKYYAITRSGTRALADQAAWWQRSADLVNRLLTSEGE